VLTEAHCHAKQAFPLRLDANNRALYINRRPQLTSAAKMNAEKHLSPAFQSLSDPQVAAAGAEIVQYAINLKCLAARGNPTDPGWKRPANTRLCASFKLLVSGLCASQHCFNSLSLSHLIFGQLPALLSYGRANNLRIGHPELFLRSNRSFFYSEGWADRARFFARNGSSGRLRDGTKVPMVVRQTR